MAEDGSIGRVAHDEGMLCGGTGISCLDNGNSWNAGGAERLTDYRFKALS
ncbi:hypothetical protein [Nitratireductor luteus]|nr:hypothetical protein [Nitratireductor luteus]